jgi:hypothetical protein
MILALALSPLGGIGRRVAGGYANQFAEARGWIKPGARVMGDVPARAIWGATLALAALAGGAVWWQAAAVVPAVVAGCSVPMWAIDPISPGYRSPIWLRCLGNEAHGLLSMALVTIGAWWFGYYWPAALIGSLAMLPAYVVGWAVARPSFPVGFRLGSEVGEFLWGCALFAGLFLTVHGA